jgi:hypothetical protein
LTNCALKQGFFALVAPRKVVILFAAEERSLWRHCRVERHPDAV